MIRQPRAAHWLIAFTLAGVAHTAAMVRLDVSDETRHRAEDPGSQSITIALAPPPKAAPPEPELEQEVAPEPAATPKTESLESPVETPEPEEQEAEPELEPEPVEKKQKPEPSNEEPEKPDERQPETTQASTDEAEPITDNENPAKQTADRRQAGATGGIQDAPPDYRTQVSAWLERHKEYPMSARRKAEQGMAMVSFTFDREGRILDYEILRPTGHENLDQAIKDMLTRANPLPKMPDQLPHDRMTWTLPVYFRLN